MLAVTAPWLLLLSGCYPPKSLGDQRGKSGWFRADRPPKTPDAYQDRFEMLALGSYGLPCEELERRQRDASKPIIVLVHGISGDGAEMEASVPILMDWGPASLFMLRWMPYEDRDGVAARLASGLNQLAQCLSGSSGRILVIAHSAGGVVASHAASLVRSPVVIFTVASPLAGTGHLPGDPEGRQQRMLARDLGTAIASYPPAAPGVRVVHLRSFAPSDSVMEPRDGHLPNDPRVGVPNAPQIDLPSDLDHTQALIHVVRRVVDGSWRQWLTGS